jgi:hypothetical protein
VFVELVLFVIFVMCVFAIAYGNRDYRAYITNAHLDNMFFSQDGSAPFPFEKVGFVFKFFTFPI